MGRHLVIAAIVVTVVAAGCTKKSAPRVRLTNYCEATQEITTPSHKGVIFPAACGPLTLVPIIEEIREYWTPTPRIVEDLESGMRAALEHWKNAPADADRHFVVTPDRATFLSSEITRILERLDWYHRQYVGVIVADDRRLVIVNCFPGVTRDDGATHRAWKHQWVSVDDGGNSYWRVQYDVDTGQFIGFDSNGYA